MFWRTPLAVLRGLAAWPGRFLAGARRHRGRVGLATTSPIKAGLAVTGLLAGFLPALPVHGQVDTQDRLSPRSAAVVWQRTPRPDLLLAQSTTRTDDACVGRTCPKAGQRCFTHPDGWPFCITVSDRDPRGVTHCGPQSAGSAPSCTTSGFVSCYTYLCLGCASDGGNQRCRNARRRSGRGRTEAARRTLAARQGAAKPPEAIATARMTTRVTA